MTWRRRRRRRGGRPVKVFCSDQRFFCFLSVERLCRTRCSCLKFLISIARVQQPVPVSAYSSREIFLEVLILYIYTHAVHYMNHPVRKPALWTALSIGPAQLKHAAQDYPDIHFSPHVDFPFQDSLLYTYIPPRRNVSVRISRRGLRRPIWVDTLRRGRSGSLTGRLCLTKLHC